MTRARIEFVQFGEGVRLNGWSQNIIRKVIASLAPITVTATATDAGDRPVVPSGDGTGPVHAIVRALDGPVIVAWGDDPTAAATGVNAKWIADGEELPIPVQPGQRLSFIEADPA